MRSIPLRSPTDPFHCLFRGTSDSYCRKSSGRTFWRVFAEHIAKFSFIAALGGMILATGPNPSWSRDSVAEYTYSHQGSANPTDIDKIRKLVAIVGNRGNLRKKHSNCSINGKPTGKPIQTRIIETAADQNGEYLSLEYFDGAEGTNSYLVCPGADGKLGAPDVLVISVMSATGNYKVRFRDANLDGMAPGSSGIDGVEFDNAPPRVPFGKQEQRSMHDSYMALVNTVLKLVSMEESDDLLSHSLR